MNATLATLTHARSLPDDFERYEAMLSELCTVHDVLDRRTVRRGDRCLDLLEVRPGTAMSECTAIIDALMKRHAGDEVSCAMLLALRDYHLLNLAEEYELS